ncbi:MAG: D-alanyl-D-alanine carboxypeptidase family protein, partial [bacterium]
MRLTRKPYFALAFILIGLLVIGGGAYSKSLKYTPISVSQPIDAYYFSEFEPEVTLDTVYSEIESRRQEIATLQQISYVSGSAACYAYPSTILPITRSGNDLLVLVNKTYQLPSTYAPSDLVNISTTGIRVTRSDLYIRSVVVTHLSSMVARIKSEGIDVAALSAYRSYGGQQATYNYWLSYNGGNVLLTDMISARAGHSQHQLGTTVDFTTSE